MVTVGANRIVPGIAIPHPTGDPAKGEAEDKAARRELVEKAFRAIQTEITDQTIFKN
jgi:glycine reductase